MKELLHNKKLVGVYLLWVTLHLLFLILSLGTNDIYYGGNAQQEFYPFTDKSFGNSYDYTEFAAYSLIPACLIIALHFIREGSKHE